MHQNLLVTSTQHVVGYNKWIVKYNCFLFPVHAWTDPEAARRLRLPHFMTVIRAGTWKWYGCHPNAQAAFTPRKYSRYSFLLEAEWRRGHSAAGRIMPVQNSNDPIGNRTRELPACNAVPQPTAPPRANVKIMFKPQTTTTTGSHAT